MPRAIPGLAGSEKIVQHHFQDVRSIFGWVLLLPVLGGMLAGYIAWDERTDATRTCEIRIARQIAPDLDPTFEACLDRLDGSGDFVNLAALGGGGAAVVVLILLWLRAATPGFVAVLERRPQDVVWVHELSVKLRGGTKIGHAVVLGLRDGTLVRLWVPSESAATEVVGAAAGLAPSAAVGYSEDRRRTFERDPAALAGKSRA